MKKEKIDKIIHSIKRKIRRSNIPPSSRSVSTNGVESEQQSAFGHSDNKLLQNNPVDALEATRLRNELFLPNMKDNRLWIHGTKAKYLESILNEGLRPATRISEDTLARWPGYSEDYEYTGGSSGSVIFWHLQPGDIKYDDGNVGTQTASINSLHQEFNKILPSNRIEFYIKSGFFDTSFLSKVSNIVNISLRTHTHFADNGLGNIISSVQDIIRNNGIFPNTAKKNEENISTLAHEIVWNEIQQILLWKSERIRKLLELTKQIKQKGKLPTSLKELNELIVAKETDEYGKPIDPQPIKKDEFIPETSAILELPFQKGTGCEGIDFLNVRTPYDRLHVNEIKSLLSWIQSLP